jgi:3,4-dihydroxy 2-butanone 4-phosphate synthase/GTP cyclohydrolase II
MEGAIERVERAIEAMKAGEQVIILDAEDRENEGDLCVAAESISDDDINFMAKHGRGLICLAMTGDRLDRLDIPMMVEEDENTSSYETAFTVSIEAKQGVTTGISAADRARTVRVAVDDDAGPEDVVTPGHVFPLRARDGGVLVRTGQTEASVDLARLAGLKPAAVICEIMNPDGTMARRPDLEEFAREHDLVMLSVSDIINYRLRHDSLVHVVEETELPTEYPGDWRVEVFGSDVDDVQHLAFVCGNPTPDEAVPVRVQHRCDTFDVFMRRAPRTCTGQMSRVMETIADRGVGAIVYLDHEPKSALDLVEHYVHDEAVRPYRVEETDADDELEVAEAEVEEERDHVNQPRESLKVVGIGAQILVELGVGRMELMTNRPKKAFGLEGYGLEIVDQMPIPNGEVQVAGETEGDSELDEDD